MTRAQMLNIIVPGTIVQWTAETPQFIHAGKERSLHRMYASYNKADLQTKLKYLTEKGYVQ